MRSEGGNAFGVVVVVPFLLETLKMHQKKWRWGKMILLSPTTLQMKWFLPLFLRENVGKSLLLTSPSSLEIFFLSLSLKKDSRRREVLVTNFWLY